MKAITLWPEWAWAGVRLDKFLNGVENRGWAPPKALVGEHLAIHAGKHVGGRPRTELLDAFAGVFEMATRAGWHVTTRGLPSGVVARFENHFMAGGWKVVHLRPDDVHLGAFVGSARLASFGPNDPTPPAWGVPGAIGWRLTDAHRLVEPVPARGSQGLWDVPAELVANQHQRARVRVLESPDGDLDAERA